MPRIYVACLASYNNGVLHGKWIDATSDEDEMQEAIDKILRSSPYPNVMVEDPETGKDVPSAEEFAIHDHEGLGNIGEYTPLSEIADLVTLLEENDTLPAHVVLAYHRDYQEDPKDNYRGQYDSWADFAREWHEETGTLNELPDWVRYHVDWDSVGREFETGGGLVEFDGHFFHTP